ncbi:recombinase family protein [Gordonia sp. PP30]|uniref:recombinase family protein n=1 Tax=Gordonia sp. PP30 TaxID=2935861 RepID=UPI001FFFD3DE|nr:recombinase family protein [Gordonia sp. PP30]UQE74688.1 recombinase family protein [Gordonia sp. PP30]
MSNTAPVQIPGRRRRVSTSAPAGTVLAYLRVSTDEQAESGAGLAAQRAAIVAEADRQGWTITGWHVDEGLSGGLAPSKRPALAAALDVLANREAAILVAAKLDRVSRSMSDAAALLDRSAREGWQLVTVDMAVDTSSPQGRAAAHMAMTFAELERGLISQRTREALATRKAAGVQLGRPTELDDDVLTRIITEASQGQSLRAIAQGLMADGIRTGAGKEQWHAPQVQRAMDSQRGQAIAAKLFG